MLLFAFFSGLEVKVPVAERNYRSGDPFLHGGLPENPLEENGKIRK
jgi:hypothetical protein